MLGMSTSSELGPAANPPRLAHRLAISTGMALLGSALAFFISLFLAIVVLLFVGFFRHVDMSLAYRRAAIPVAVLALPITLIASWYWQGRRLART